MFNGKQVSVTEHNPSIAVLRIHNPPHGFMDDVTEKELVKALDALDAVPRINVVVITGGQQDVFVRHYDTLVLEARARQMTARGMAFDPRRPVPEAGVHRVLRQIESSPATYIAAINGMAMGGGFELALACDFRLAEAGNYPIGLPEVNIGLLPGAGGTQRLRRLIGEAKALELMLLGDTLTPRDALTYGLVNDVVNAPVLPNALQLAEALTHRPARARAHIKRLVRGTDHAEESQFAESLAIERTLFCDLMVQRDAVDRMQKLNAGEMTIQGNDIADAA